MSVLSPERRKELERACVRGRHVAEAASRAAIGTLGVLDERPPAHLSEEDRDLRRALRAKRDQLGDQRGQIDLLVADCAYEQWHRLLFGRFLAENKLLIHPEFGVNVSMAECDELAADLGEPDAWAVAGRFATEILPGIFRLDDPCVRIRLAPEGRLALEQIVESIPADTFAADDALGWVYQHWQKERKDEVNASERKIGGADLAPVTQLFTENYMVRFLLENSLGAYWASRHPDSPLLAGWKYLRYGDDGKPVAGPFEGWPPVIAEVTVMDPCCGSGHFLVEAFDMLWRMRVEEDNVTAAAAQDAVLRDNLFGLELDPRCVQIATFAVVLATWKAGGGWRALPVPNVACSGIPIKTSAEKWHALAHDQPPVERALDRLYSLFRDADTLGSLVDPRRSAEQSSSDPQRSLDDVDWHELAPLIQAALDLEAPDPAAVVLGSGAVGLARTADYLSRRYDLVATNVPYLTRVQHAPDLQRYLEAEFPTAASDLATAFHQRCLALVGEHGVVADVTPQNWLYLGWYKKFRRMLLAGVAWQMVVRLGTSAFGSISGEVVNVCLTITQARPPGRDDQICVLDVQGARGPVAKADLMETMPAAFVTQSAILTNPDARFMSALGDGTALASASTSPTVYLSDYAECHKGLATGDIARFFRFVWEVSLDDARWALSQGTVSESVWYGGRDQMVLWEAGRGALLEFVVSRLGESGTGAWIRGKAAWGRAGVAVSQMSLSCTLYTGELFDESTGALVPADPSDLPAIWAYCSSEQFAREVRRIDQSLKVPTRTLTKVPFDRDYWRDVAAQRYPAGLPPPHTDDPTQWLFTGHPRGSAAPLQVAVGRLTGYRWRDQPGEDDLDQLADADGIVSLPSVLGERSAADRLQELLARAFGGTWSAARAAELLAGEGSKKGDLDLWLRDEFFKAHCQTFKNRPFIWHIWDGRKDGFSALLNYHRLDRTTLERVAYTYLGDWIERQTAGAREDVIGAEERLIAARELQRKLELILAGEPPYDIYVRWKPVGAQAIGWAPDPDDGVRLNIRPFVQAGVLRAKFNVKWEKDRGKNPDGSERHNDVHLTNAQKQAARDAGTRA